MIRRILLSLVGSLVLVAGLLADEGRIAKLIQQLGSDRFAERESASQELEAIGVPALTELRKAAASADIETRRRAEELIVRIEKKLESLRVLTATKVSVAYHDRPLAEAVADLAKRAGQPVMLGEPVQRTVTLKLDNVDFWVALERLRQAANLSEATAVAVPLKQGVPIQARRPGASANQIVLIDKPYQELPTSFHQAARVRALPDEPSFRRDQLGCVLGVALESGLPIRKIISVRIDQAVDDQGQPLEHVASDTGVGNPAFIGNVGGQAQDLLTTSGQHQVPVRFKAGAGKQLRTLAGSLAVEVRARPEVLLSINNIMKAAGQTAKGKASGALTVQDVSKDKGAIQVRVELQPPAESNANNGGAIQIQNIQVIQIGVGGRIETINSGGDVGLALLDANGQPFDLAGIPSRRTRIDQNGVSHEYLLVFQPREGQAEPTRLTYSSSRPAIVEIPFTLRDVPLR